MRTRTAARLGLAALLLAAAAPPAGAARLKDLASVRGARSNQLIGYGLVVGLQGTGDDQAAFFMLRSVQLMLRRLGVRVTDPSIGGLTNLRLKNVAAVMVTADLPPFARAGSRIDVTVSSVGNAKSLQGGTLLLTPLRGVDLKVYALAQGPLSVGGYTVGGRTGSRKTKNHPTVARVPRGALVEREVPSRFVKDHRVVVALAQPDFTTVERLARAIRDTITGTAARAIDPATIVVQVPEPYRKRPVALVSALEQVEVEPDRRARVIVSERTGTVVVGQRVRLRPVAIAHGSLTLEVSEKIQVSQPTGAFTRGRTAVVPRSKVAAKEAGGSLTVLDRGASLAEVVQALNALGASPRDLITILQLLRAEGALQGEVEVR